MESRPLVTAIVAAQCTPTIRTAPSPLAAIDQGDINTTVPCQGYSGQVGCYTDIFSSDIGAVLTSVGANIVLGRPDLPRPNSNVSVLYAGQNLYSNQHLSSPNGKFAAEMGTDGNFVLYSPNTFLWATWT